MAQVQFDASDACPLWERCLGRWMGGNQGLIRYLQRVVGYGLTTDVSEQSLWFFYGHGANGKSTFLLTILAMLGGYAMQAVSDLLMVKHHESHPTERADLFGKRFVATIETEEGKRIAEALMKQVTGGDPIRPQAVQGLLRVLPDAQDRTGGQPQAGRTRHRLRRLATDQAGAWTVTIPEAEKDKHLPDKLKTELPGNPAMGHPRLPGLATRRTRQAEEVTRATAAYQAEQDTVKAFIDECCNRHPEAKAQSSASWRPIWHGAATR